MFSAVAELDPNIGVGADNETCSDSEQLEVLTVLTVLTPVSNDNARGR